MLKLFPNNYFPTTLWVQGRPPQTLGVIKRILHLNRVPQITDPYWSQTNSQFFSDKVKSLGRSVEAKVANTTPICVNTLADQPKILDTLSSVTVCEVSKLLQSILNKSNSLDFLPTKLFKDCQTLWALIIANMANLCTRDYCTRWLWDRCNTHSSCIVNWKCYKRHRMLLRLMAWLHLRHSVILKYKNHTR